jgi:hypothetical protein
VYLRNLNRVLPKGQVVPIPIMARIIVGAPLEVVTNEDKDSFLKRAQLALAELEEL